MTKHPNDPELPRKVPNRKMRRSWGAKKTKGIGKAKRIRQRAIKQNYQSTNPIKQEQIDDGKPYTGK